MRRMAEADYDGARLISYILIVGAWIHGNQDFSTDPNRNTCDSLIHLNNGVRSLTLSNALALSDDPPPSYAAATSASIEPTVQSSAEAPAISQTDSALASGPNGTYQVRRVAKGERPRVAYKILSHEFLRFSSTTPALWWGLKSATTFLLELLRSDGIWSNEKKFRITEVALAIVWVRLVCDAKFKDDRFNMATVPSLSIPLLLLHRLLNVEMVRTLYLPSLPSFILMFQATALSPLPNQYPAPDHESRHCLSGTLDSIPFGCIHRSSDAPPCVDIHVDSNSPNNGSGCASFAD